MNCNSSVIMECETRESNSGTRNWNSNGPNKVEGKVIPGVN
jgi:hypothetical protein